MHLVHECSMSVDFRVLAQQTWALLGAAHSIALSSWNLCRGLAPRMPGFQGRPQHGSTIKEPAMGHGAKGKLSVFRECKLGAGCPLSPELLPPDPESDAGPNPGPLVGFKDTVAIWKREHYQSPCWRASVIIIFISIKGVLWQDTVRFNLVWIGTWQGLIFYFCPGLNLPWIIQCSSTSKH